MKTRLNESNNGSFGTFSLNKVLNHLNYGLRYRNQLTNFLFNYGRYLPKTTRFNPNLLNASSVAANNYDYGVVGSWLKIVFLKNTMKINVVDNSSKIVNSTSSSPQQPPLLSSVDRIEFKNEQLPPFILPNNSNLNSVLNIKTNLSNNEPLVIPSPTQRQQIQTSVYNKTVFFITNDYAWLKHLLAGATAGVASRTCTAPLDRIKVLLQVRSAEIPSIRSCYKFIKEEGGYRAFWRGNGINCIKIAPEIAFRFMFYEQFKRYIKGDNDRQLFIYERLISGSLAGSLSQSIIYPMEVIKTRLCLRTTGQYKGIADAIRKIYRIEGYRTFYRGFCVNLAGILPYSGIDLTVYEIASSRSSHKILPGLEIFYQSVANNLKSRNDSVVALLHYTLVCNGFKCIGIGEQFEENAKDSAGSELLPKDWNAKEFYILRYVQPSKKRLLLVKIVPSDAILLVNVLLKSNDQIYATTVDPKKVVTNYYKEFSKLFVDGESLSWLINEVKKEILDKFDTPAKSSTNTTRTSLPASSEQRPEPRGNPLLIGEPRLPSQMVPSQMIPSSGSGVYPPFSPFPQVGGADLDPLGRGFGGGMLVDPRGLQEQFNNPSRFGQPRHPGRLYDPSTGLDRPLQPGAVPPGARFEHFGPPPRPGAQGPNYNQANRPPFHPDLERPPGYDDMFM